MSAILHYTDQFEYVTRTYVTRTGLVKDFFEPIVAPYFPLFIKPRQFVRRKSGWQCDSQTVVDPAT